MALVGYSDSESSGTEDVKSVPVPESKKFDRTSSKKIKVDLSALTTQPDPSTTAQPAAKRQRTTGAFGGFNSLLPAPKRAAQAPLKKGVSLKTSSEAAFSREPIRSHAISRQDEVGQNESTQDSSTAVTQKADEPVSQPVEVKIVGKTTRFVPLSVANARKKKPIPMAAPLSMPEDASGSTRDRQQHAVPTALKPPPAAPAKPKRSLFATQPEESSAASATPGEYEPEFSRPTTHDSEADEVSSYQTPVTQAPGLQAVAADLNLSESERRRLFGRDAKRGDLKVAHFDMDAEYKSNQELAAKGEQVEHRAVRAIAPGKHSLQQLVNNVRGQTDAIEDKWAEGRRNRSEAGSKYGW